MAVPLPHSFASTETWQTITDVLRYRGQFQSDRLVYIILEDGEVESARLTYQELDEQAKAIAASLQSVAQKGDPFGDGFAARALLLYPSGLEFISAFLGCLYAGIVAIPAYPPRLNQKITRLQAIVEDADVHLVLTTDSLLEQTQGWFSQEGSTGNIQCLATDRIPSHQANDWQDPHLDSQDLAFLQYTSGSTGTPKGVMVSHGNLMHNERLIKMGFGHSEKSMIVGWLPLFHDMGLIGNILQPLYLGCTCVLMPPVAFLQKPIRWLQAISRYKATTSGGPNFAYDLCVRKIKPEQCTDLDLRSWNIAFNGAEPVRAETLLAFTETFSPYGFRRQTFYPCYGMAETTLFVSGGLKTAPPVFYAVERTALSENCIEKANGSLSESQILVGCGQTFFDKIVIVNPISLQRCASKQVGEIWVSGKSVAQGYWNQPEQTQQSFGAYLADTGEGPFLRTGDLGFFDCGELFITGRLKDVIIIRGRNYYPQDIELTVEKSHPALRTGCGAAFSLEVNSGEQLVIVQEVERSYLRKLESKEVFKAIRRAISDQYELQVHSIVLLKTASIHKTSSGKIQRHACKAAFLAGSLQLVETWVNPQYQKVTSLTSVSSEFQAHLPTTQMIQTRIIEWLSQELNLDLQTIEPQTSFADLGLDSVNGVELAQELGDWFGLALSATLAWDFATIEALANYLAEEVRSLKNEPSPTLPEIAQPMAPISNLADLKEVKILI